MIKNKLKGIKLPDFNTCYIYTRHYIIGIRIEKYIKRIKPRIDTHVYGELTFGQNTTTAEWGNGKYLQQMELEQMDKCMEKK